MRIEKIMTNAGEIAAVRPETGEDGEAYLRAEIGTLAGLSEKSTFVYSALKGNFFYRDTDGAVISIDEKGERAYLTERVDDAVLGNGAAAGNDAVLGNDAAAGNAAREAVVNGFAATLRLWRERLESGKIPAGTEA